MCVILMCNEWNNIILLCNVCGFINVSIIINILVILLLYYYYYY